MWRQKPLWEYLVVVRGRSTETRFLLDLILEVIFQPKWFYDSTKPRGKMKCRECIPTGRVFSSRVVSFLMGTRSRGECSKGRHSKQREIITLDFFSYQFCNLKLPRRDVFWQSSSHFQTKELFSLPPPLPSSPLVWMYGWRKMIAGIVWQQQPQSLFWKRVGSGSWARTERERERGGKNLPGQINNSVLEDASPVFLLFCSSLCQDPAMSVV